MADPVERLTHALADRCAIEREIGSGGMATVYLAEDLKHERPVSLKVEAQTARGHHWPLSVETFTDADPELRWMINEAREHLGLTP